MKKFSVSLPDELKTAAGQVATEQHSNLSSLMHDALVAYLDTLYPGMVTEDMRAHPGRGEGNRIRPPISEEAGATGEEIRRRRKDHRLTQEELAELAGLPYYVVEMAERGLVPFNEDTIGQIMAVLPDPVPVTV